MKLKKIKYIIFFIISILSGLVSCVDDPGFNSGIHNASEPEIGNLIVDEQNLTASTVVLKSSVLKANGYPVKERGFIWNTDSVIPKDNKDLWLPVGDGIGDYSDTIRNLSPGIKYYFWSYAKNEINISYSNFDTIRTNNGLGILKTEIPGEYLHATNAVVIGKIINTGEGNPIERGVYYSKINEWEKRDSIQSKSSLEIDSFVCELLKLEPDERYIAQAYFINEISDFKIITVGDTVHFTTNKGIPAVDSIIKIDIGFREVTVFSRIIDPGDAPIIEYGFCWGTDPKPTKENGEYKASNNLLEEFSLLIDNLEPQTKYYICAYAVNIYGIAYSETDTSFYVNNDIPTLSITQPYCDYDAGTLLLEGQIINKGKSDIFSRGFCYSTNVDPTVYNSTVIEILTTSDQFSKEISELKGNTTYYVRAYATNNEGISYSNVAEITTPDILKESSPVFPGSIRLTGSSTYFMNNNRGYLLGGDMGAENTDELWSYYATSDNTGIWQQFKSYSKPFKWSSVAVYGTFAYVLGGLETDYTLMDNFSRFNTSGSNIWTDLITGPDPAYSRVGVTLGNTAYYIGGKGNSVNDEVWVYDFTPSGGWTQNNVDFPVKQYGGIALNIDNDVYVGMGKDEEDVCNKTLWKLEDDGFNWREETDNSLINTGIIVGTAYKNKIYLVDEAFYIHEYDLSTKLWTRKTRINAGEQDIHGMFILNDKIYIGLINNKMYIYYPLWDN